jgi:two-component system cell cycle sensor histidine kinase/response regulator CckA
MEKQMKSDLPTELYKVKETVLLIDDDEMVVDVGELILNNSGYDVVIAKSGKEAIDVYKENHNRIDMVILDMILPDMDGGDTYDRLKEINPGIKVLLASGYDIDYHGRDIMERGCNGFIQKPFNMNELLEKIREILASK